MSDVIEQKNSGAVRYFGSLLMKMVLRSVIVITIFVLGFQFYFYLTPPKSPVISLGVKSGILSDEVLLLKNTSQVTQKVRVYIYEGDLWQSTEVIECERDEEEKVGYFEFARKWKPKAGNKGFIQIEGQESVIYFEIVAPEVLFYGEQRHIPQDFPGRH
jgi:hypothetical protein